MAGLDSYTKLLLHCDGTDASISFPDKSASAHTVTANGDAHVGTAQSKFGGASAYFDGTGDYLSIPDSTDWDFGSGNFTIDMWIYPISSSGSLFAQYESSSIRTVLCLDNNKVQFYSNGGAIVLFESGASTITNNVWQHIAIVRNGDVYTIYINGSSAATQTVSGSLPNVAAAVNIGRRNDATDYFTGYIDEIRVSKGIARWNGTFTPQTTAYDYNYPIEVVGSSSYSGVLTLLSRYFPVEAVGSSTSLGTLILARWPIIAAGVSNTSGIIESLHHRFRELTGESSSAGDMPLHRDIPLSAISISSGLDMLKMLLLYAGSSSSSGTLTLSEIEALEALACYLINLDTKRTRQYTNYAFTGIGRFNGKMLASFADGIYDLDTEAKYDGTSAEIPASMEIKTDFGTANYKSIRAVYIDDDKAWVTITDSDGNYAKHDISPTDMRSIKKDMRDKEFTIKIENISGSNITLRRLHGKLNVLQRKGV